MYVSRAEIDLLVPLAEAGDRFALDRLERIAAALPHAPECPSRLAPFGECRCVRSEVLAALAAGGRNP